MVDFKQLAAPFLPDRVSWRIGSTSQDKSRGLALAYIDARDVMERLDEVCGPAGWQRRYPHANGKTVCEVGIKINDEWIWKADGAGDTDVEAEKGALSDAFKRAAVSWGIGRYLYDLPSPWVKIEQAGRSYRIADDEYSKLERLLGVKDQAQQLDEQATLIRDASAAAEAGVEAYKNFYLSLTAADRTSLANIHDKLKARAIQVSNPKGKAA